MALSRINCINPQKAAEFKGLKFLEANFLRHRRKGKDLSCFAQQTRSKQKFLEKTRNWTFVCGKVFWNNCNTGSQANSNLPCTVPDETTHCRFRNARVKADTYEGLLAEICRQTEGHGLKMKEAAAAIIYATLIGSAAQPLTHIEAPPEDCSKMRLRPRLQLVSLVPKAQCLLGQEGPQGHARPQGFCSVRCKQVRG